MSVPELMNVRQAGEYLGLCPSTVWRMTKARQIPYLRLSQRRIRFRKVDVDRWLESKVVRPATTGGSNGQDN